MQISDTINGEQVRRMIRSALHDSYDARHLHRLDGVLLVAEGRSCGEVATWFGVNRRTVERWVHAAGVQGVDSSVKRQCQTGRPAKLSCAQAQQVRLALLVAPSAFGYPDRHWVGKRLALHLTDQYGITLSVRSCQRMIARSRVKLLRAYC